jgi:hypothetical protein
MDFWDTNSKNVFTTTKKGQCASGLYQCKDGTNQADCKNNGGNVIGTAADGSMKLCAEAQESWYLKTDNKSDGETGTFTIIDNYTSDPNMYEKNGCTPLYTLPENATHAARIGSVGDAETWAYNDTYKNGTWYTAGAWQIRAMAEKLVYTFEVTEKSNILKLAYATVLEEPEGASTGAHYGDEYPTMDLNVTVETNGEKITLPCASYHGTANSSDNTLVALKNKGTCFKSDLAGVTYKPWVTNLYDLRKYVGSKVTIVSSIHDCLVHTNVYGSSNTTSGSGKSYSKLVAGGHIGYGYLTGSAMEMRIDAKNCPDDDKVEIYVPEGFGEGNYRWYTADGTTLKDDNGQPYTDYYAYVNRAEIQDIDYICTIKGSNESCNEITVKTRLAKEPIVAKFGLTTACTNEVTFSDSSFVTKILQYNPDEKLVQPDTIVKWSWRITPKAGNTAGETIEHNDLDSTAAKKPITEKIKYGTNGEYEITLTLETVNGCFQTLTKEFKVQPEQNPELNGVVNICANESSTLQVGNLAGIGNRYIWYKGNVIVQDSTKEDNSSSFDIAGNIQKNAGI